MRTVAVAPDGRLWVTTSNRDGRGDPGAGRRPDPVSIRLSLDSGATARLAATGRGGGPATTPVTVARREARRSVVSTAGPSTTSATALVIARPVSQLPVDVSSV